MEIKPAQVKELRERTGVGIMDCKSALKEAKGDIEEAIRILRTMGKAKAAKRAGRTAGEGRIESYVHMGGKIAVLLELNCETDFVARNEDFAQLARDLAMHVAAAGPRYLSRDDVDGAALEAEREVYRQQALGEGKPANIVDRIVDGKIGRFYSDVCLLEQPYIKDTDKKVQDLLTDAIAKIGENIVVSRFVRIVVGEPEMTVAATKATEGE